MKLLFKPYMFATQASQNAPGSFEEYKELASLPISPPTGNQNSRNFQTLPLCLPGDPSRHWIGKHTETKISLRAQRASRKALLNGRSITRFHQLHETLHVHEAILSTPIIFTEEWLITHGMDSTMAHLTCTRRNQEQLC